MVAEDAVEVIARLLVVAGVELRHGVVVVLFRSLEAELRLRHLPSAGGHVHAAALKQMGRSGGQQLFKGLQRLLIFARLQKLHGRLVVLKGCRVGLTASGVAGRSACFFSGACRGAGFLHHVVARSLSELHPLPRPQKRAVTKRVRKKSTAQAIFIRTSTRRVNGPGGRGGTAMGSAGHKSPG